MDIDWEMKNLQRAGVEELKVEKLNEYGMVARDQRGRTIKFHRNNGHWSWYIE